MAYATTLCDGEMPHTKDYIQSELRNHLYNCLQRSTPLPLPFPSVQRRKCLLLSIAVVVYQKLQPLE